MGAYPFYTEPGHQVGPITTTGPNDTSVSKAEGRLVLDVVDKIFLLEPNMNPLTTFLLNVGKTVTDGSAGSSGILSAACVNPEFSWINPLFR
jgi:hypothetical protein